jgi:signal transduction histidine kinase
MQDAPEAAGVQRVVLVGPAFRALALPIPLALLVRDHPGTHLGSLVAVAVPIAAANALFAYLIGGRRTAGWHLRRSVFAADIAVTAGLNLWASTQIPRGTIFLTNSDVFWIYTLGTVVFWTAARGNGVGLALALGGVPLQLGMGYLNHVDFASMNLLEFGTRQLWLMVAYVVMRAMTALSSQSLARAAEEGRRAGREAERARALRSMHDTVLQSLEAMTARLDRRDLPPDERVAWARSVASEQSNELRRLLRRSEEEPGEIYDKFSKVVSAFEVATGIPTEFVYLGPVPTVAADAEDALLGGTGEALQNAGRHASPRSVNVLISTGADRVRVIVRDDGCGFDPTHVREGAFGIAESIVQRMVDAGGGARVQSSPGEGTRVELWVPVVVKSTRVSTWAGIRNGPRWRARGGTSGPADSPVPRMPATGPSGLDGGGGAEPRTEAEV